MKKVNGPLSMYLSISLYWFFKLNFLGPGNCRFNNSRKTRYTDSLDSFQVFLSSQQGLSQNRSFHFGRELASLSGESNGTPLQYSCLENPKDGGTW